MPAGLPRVAVSLKAALTPPKQIATPQPWDPGLLGLGLREFGVEGFGAF